MKTFLLFDAYECTYFPQRRDTLMPFSKGVGRRESSPNFVVTSATAPTFFREGPLLYCFSRSLFVRFSSVLCMGQFCSVINARQRLDPVVVLLIKNKPDVNGTDTKDLSPSYAS